MYALGKAQGEKNISKNSIIESNNYKICLGDLTIKDRMI